MSPGFRISFGVKTNLAHEGSLLLTVASIRAQGMPAGDFEVLVTGTTEVSPGGETGLQGVRLLPDADAAEAGRLGHMMNTLVSNARFENVCLLDDDIVLLDGWYEKVHRWVERSGGYDVIGFAIRNTDGTRYWDWAEQVSPGASRLLRYGKDSPRRYVSGGCVLLRKAVWERVPWDPERGYYEQEDVDWCRRVVGEGLSLGFCANAAVVHNDCRYTQRGPRVPRLSREEALDAGVERSGIQLMRDAMVGPLDMVKYVLSRVFGLPGRMGVRGKRRRDGAA